MTTLDVCVMDKRNPPKEPQVICLHHLVKDQTVQLPKFLLEKFGRVDCGDCHTCTPDPINNPYCKRYYPIHIKVVEGGLKYGQRNR